MDGIESAGVTAKLCGSGTRDTGMIERQMACKEKRG